MKIITVAVIKGGTGKSTTCAAIAQAATADGKTVLAIDLDPQANLSNILGADQNKPGAVELLHGENPGGLMQETEQGIAVIAGSPNLSAETTGNASAKRLETALRPLRGIFDLCVIDTPPHMGEMVFNALQACDSLIIPLETDTNGIQGLYQIADIAHQIQQYNTRLTIAGVVLTRYDPRPKLNRFILSAIEDAGREVEAPILGTVRAGVAIREAQALRRSIYEYDPKSKPAKDYWGIYKKIMEE